MGRCLLKWALPLLLIFATGLASADINLRFTSWDGDISLRVLRKLCDEFEAQNPGVHIDLEQIPDYGVYHQKMVVEYAANAAPDVAMMDPAHFQFLAERGALLPLNPFFSQTPGFNIKDYYPRIVAAHTLDGKLYVLPRDIAPEGLIYYNKAAFKAAGIPYPDGSWTWDFHERPWLKDKDFLWVLDRLTEFNKDGSVKRYGYTPSDDHTFLDVLAYGSGLRYTDDPQHPTKVLPDLKGWIKVGDFLHWIEDVKHWAPTQSMVTSNLQSAAYQLFVRGQTAMYQDGIWQVPQIRRDLPPGGSGFFDWDIAPFPRYVGSPVMRGPTGGSGYAIFSTCAHPEMAWKFLTFMAGPPGMTAMAEAGIAQPAVRKVALSDAWIPGPHTPYVQQWPHNRIITDQEVANVVFAPTSPYWQDASSYLSAKLDTFFNGIISARQAFTEGQQESQDRLDYLRHQADLPVYHWGEGAVVGVLIVAAIALFVYWPERNKKYTQRQKQENKSAYKFISIWIIGMFAFTLGPMILSLLMSGTNWDMITPATWRGWGNFQEAFTADPRFWVSIKVTFIYAAVRVPLSLIFAFLLALLLNVRVRGIPLYRAAFYIPSLASGVASSLIWMRIFSPNNGLLNSFLYNPWINHTFHIGDWLSNLAGTPHTPVNWIGSEQTALSAFILMSLWGVGGSTIILLAGLQGVPDMYYEAATVDGASPFKKMKTITIPLLTPALFFTLITGCISAFHNFTDVYVVTGGTGGPNNSTMLYMLNLYNMAFANHRFGYAAALGWMLFGIILIVTLVQFQTSKWVYYEAEVKR